MTILSQCQSGIWRLITSTALDAELDQTPDLERLKNVKKILAIAKIKVISSQLLEDRAAELQKLAFSSYDAALSQVLKEAKQTSSSQQTIDSSKKPRKILNVLT